ncbi:enoyl-CoA hydratase-related protein [Arachidicoccus terrestris]|uniref:enoyl-CoA hydratase-related protein n=1 Tax=Arachidicoccus terrestris TaxID=2875539 RepID=UPI001CC77CC2|nr:enoyl-CoA hydratase-related protein [Arachidicoccus terrestris]UAY56636.1 enoyl-CoA hydratase/isomerase family protein [Arachidicoccus terrestris]
MMNILITIDDNIQTIAINRPESLNALNGSTLKELSEALDEAEHNPSIRVIIITGSGEKSFVAGADIKEFADYDSAAATEMSRKGQATVFDKIEHLRKPVIAAINGFALGGGLELALACHIRYASENARLGLPEVTLGLIPGYGGTQRLPKLVGKGLANEMILSAKMISAGRAKEIGLVNEVFPLAELMEKTRQLADSIAKNSPMGIAEAIQAVNASDAENGFEKEMMAFGRLFDMSDKKEGVTAFLEKRKPIFKN